MKVFSTLTALWRKPTHMELVARELDQAYKDKLEAETHRDYAQSLVNYNNDRITRLKGYYVATAESPADKD